VQAPAREQDGIVAAGLNSVAKPAPPSVRAQLDRILASPGFAASERVSCFLRFIVEQALAGQQVKETLIGVEVFGRKLGYDPRLDGVVRVEAVKLRLRLKEYYETAGAADPVHIDLPKGGYVPAFTSREPVRLEVVPARARRGWWTDWRIIVPPLALLALLAGYFLTKGPRPRMAPADSSSSIAVLPFVNLSSDKDNEYFSDGLTDDLINALTKVRGLRVVARSSVFQFKDKNPDIRTVGRQLNVATVLEGSVQKSGDRLRITAQLSSVADGYHLWSETYDRELKDVFAVQDEISRAIARSLEVQGVGGTNRTLVTSPTRDLDAYSLYLQGRFHLNKWEPTEARKGIEYFKQALAKDPSYAPAYAGLADCYTWLAVFGWSPARQAMPLAREAANHALQLNEGLPAAHVSLGYVKSLYDWDWAGAQRQFERALEISPGDTDAHFAYSMTYLTPLGRLDEAVAEMNRALALDPLSTYKITSAGMIYADRREPDRAVEQFRRAIALDPLFDLSYEEWRSLECARGRSEEVAQITNEMRAVFPDVSDLAARAFLSSRRGDRQEALALVQQWMQSDHSERGAGKNCYIAEVYARIGEKQLALEYLDKAYAGRNPMLVYAKVMPSFDSLRGEPRFHQLLHNLGLE
jgi:TolB-like protein/tetratricopeptide (TPR) repeat protein